MLRMKKRGSHQLYALLMILSVGLLVATAFSATQLVEAKKGGTIHIAPGVELKILPGALEVDTVISADIIREEDYIGYWFGPDGTTFAKPARLQVSLKVLNDVEDVDDFTLYGEYGEEITPRIKGKRLIYHIPHFSLYYFRRR